MDISTCKENDQIFFKNENGTILDYRSPYNPLNELIVSCEHATNELPYGYRWSPNDEYFKNEHWGLDIGALNLAKELGMNLKTFVVHSLYSRLLVDVNRSLLSETLFRKEGDGKKVELNEDLNELEESTRL